MCYFCFSFRPCRAENWTFGKIVKKWTRITYFQFLSQIDFVFSIFYLFKKETGARVFCSLRYCVLGKQFSVSVCSEFICDKLIWHRRTCGKKNLCRLIELDAIKNKNFQMGEEVTWCRLNEILNLDKKFFCSRFEKRFNWSIQTDKVINKIVKTERRKSKWRLLSSLSFLN